jgi:hypothetical protein
MLQRSRKPSASATAINRGRPTLRFPFLQRPLTAGRWRGKASIVAMIARSALLEPHAGAAVRAFKATTPAGNFFVSSRQSYAERIG